MTAWFVILAITLTWAGALFVWLAGDKRPKLQHGFAIFFSLAAACAAIALIPNTSETAVLAINMGTAFGVFTFVPNSLGVFLAVVATTIGSLAIIFSVDYMRGEAQLGRYYVLVLLFIGSMTGLVLSGSLLLLFLFWEITAFCSYALISFYNDDPKAVSGGVKALIITQVGGAGLLIGTLAAYSYLGTYQINTVLAQSHSLPPNVLAFIAFSFLIAAMAKSAQIPLHTWLPDAMEAPTPVSALIHAATMVNAGVYLLARFYPAFEEVAGWKTAVLTIGMLTALLAASMAVVANDLKRVLAYSTVSQLGYMVYAIGVGGVLASQFHLMSHAVFKALLFLAAGAVIHSVGTRDMRQMGGLRKKMPVTSVVFIIGALALAGIPILNGFWSKELVLEVGLHEGPMWAYLGVLLGAGITAFYSFRMVYMVFFGQSQTDASVHIHKAGTAMKVALIPLAIGTLTTWLLIGPFSAWMQATMPGQHFHVATTMEYVMEILTAPATYLAMAVVALGLAIYWWRGKLA
ncbi:MAG: NADH-quinone oxidoreductase subunit L, partial [Anaerolineae bacterium]|nr:NADH-quinone oxidoreductase subunit L [Anaerolineae bacterium]